MATTVFSAFNTLLSWQGLTTAQQDTATGRVSGITKFFSRNFEISDSVFPIGSYDRGTICSGERDIDLMAPLKPYGPSKYWDRYQHDSRSFLYWVRDELNDRYATTKVSSRQVCVKLDFTEIVTDVTPCFPRSGGGYLMPDGAKGWMSTNPPFHSSFMIDANRQHSSKLKPLVRLVKAWNIANGRSLRSFHLELMVEQLQRGYTIGANPEEVAYTLKTLPTLVQQPFYDPWSSGVRVDSYLSSDGRDAVIRLLQDDATRAEKAEEYRNAGKIESAFERWNMVFNHQFPAYG